MTACPFCLPNPERLVSEDDQVRVLRDGFPISPGHTLIVPRRHVASFFELTAGEQHAVLQALILTRENLQTEYQPDGVNVGLNDGEAAGQTVLHCHLHLIPRYAGDREDPRGGVRWVIPEKARYW